MPFFLWKLPQLNYWYLPRPLCPGLPRMTPEMKLKSVFTYISAPRVNRAAKQRFRCYYNFKSTILFSAHIFFHGYCKVAIGQGHCIQCRGLATPAFRAFPSIATVFCAYSFVSYLSFLWFSWCRANPRISLSR